MLEIEVQHSIEARKIQVNKKLNSQNFASKKELEAEVENYNNISNWTTYSITPKQLYELVSQGFAVRGGIKKGGNSKENVTEVNWLLLDFDTTTEQQTLANELSQYACFWYRTPSYESGINHKHRLVFALDKSVDVETYEKLYKIVRHFYPESDNTSDAGRFFFGAKYPEYTYLLQENAVLPVQAILAMQNSHNKQEEKKSVKSEVTKTEENLPLDITYLVLEHFYTEWKKSKLSVLNLYNIGYNHKFKQRNPDAANILEKYDGMNPFSLTNTTGTSFCITYFEGLFPTHYDRSKLNSELNYKQDRYKDGGSYIRYWYEIHKLIAQQQGRPNPYPDGLKAHFTQIVNDICKHFKWEKFDFKASKEIQIERILNWASQEFDSLIFKLKKEKTPVFYAWSEKETKWEIYASLDNLYSEIILPKLVSTFGLKIAQIKDVASALMLHFKRFQTIGIDRIPEENLRYAPFKNGLYDLQNKELIPNNGQSYNMMHYPYNYEEVSEDDELIQEFNEYFKYWANSDKVGQILIDWLILCVQRNAWKTQKIMGLFGTSGKGKSTYCLLINQLLGNFAINPDSDLFTSSYAHASEVLENKYHLFLEELTGRSVKSEAASLKVLLRLAGNAGSRKLTINPKGRGQFEIDFYGSITFDCENIPYIPSSQMGYFRRIVFVQVTPNNPNTNVDFIRRLKSDEGIKKLLSWCMQQDGDVVLQRFNRNCNDSILTESVQTIRRESDTMAQYILEHFELTESIDDQIKTEDICFHYNSICQQFGFGVPFSNRAKFSKMFYEKLTDKSLGFKWKGDKKQIGNTRQMGLTHLKFIADTTSTQTGRF